MSVENIPAANLKKPDSETILRDSFRGVKGVQEICINHNVDIVTIHHTGESHRDDFTNKLLELGYPEATQENGLLHQFKTCRNCTDDRVQEAERARHEAEAAMKAKQQFLSNMSHEIRTPMNGILGFTNLVLKTELTEKQREYLNAVKESGDSLLVLINDILDLAKVDAGKINFEQTPFKVASSLSAMLYMFEPDIQKKGLILAKEYDRKIPEIVIGDPAHLHQIISNLVSNAIKFTVTGKITLRTILLDEDEQNAKIAFEVQDTGIGIPDDKLENIFENFQQAFSSTARIYGGTGLGLGIVKRLVEAQGGTIHIKSKTGAGTIFRFTLNFKKIKTEPKPRRAKRHTESILPPDLKNIEILVVEDNTLNQVLMNAILDGFGFAGDFAANGRSRTPVPSGS